MPVLNRKSYFHFVISSYAGKSTLREAMLTIGTLLLFGGGLMAIAATTAMGAGALISQPSLQQMGWSLLIATIISFIGAVLIIRNR